MRASIDLGITRIRLTGGEPVARRDLVELVSAIALVEGVRDLALTTNGFRLPELAGALGDAGLKRVNVSLDRLRRERFAAIVGRDALEKSGKGSTRRKKQG